MRLYWSFICFAAGWFLSCQAWLSPIFKKVSAVAQSKQLIQIPEQSKVAILKAGLFVPLMIPFAAVAAEGTGRAFGIDDGRLVWAAIAPALLIFPLYSKWSKDQESDDFFDGYEKRRNG